MAAVKIIACPHCKLNILDRAPTLKPEEQESIIALDCCHIIHGSCIRDIFHPSKDRNETLCPFPSCQKSINTLNSLCIKPFCEIQWLQAQIVNSETVSAPINHNKHKMDLHMVAHNNLPNTLPTPLQPLMSNTNLLTIESPGISLTSNMLMSITEEEKLPPWQQRNKDVVKNENIVIDNDVEIVDITMNPVTPQSHPSSHTNATGYYQQTAKSSTIDLGHGKSTIAKQQVADETKLAEAIYKQQISILLHGTPIPPSLPAKRQRIDFPLKEPPAQHFSKETQNKDQQQNESSNGKCNNKQPEHQHPEHQHQSNSNAQSHKSNQVCNIQLPPSTPPSDQSQLSDNARDILALKFMAPFVPTGSTMYNLAQGSYENSLAYFANEHLLMGDGYIFNALKNASSGRNYGDNLENTRFYKPEMTIQQMMDIIDAMPELPQKLVIAVGSSETRKRTINLATMVEEYRKLLHKLYSKRVRALIVLPTILYPNAPPIRNAFNGVLMRQASVNLAWDYLYGAGYMNIESVRPPIVCNDRIVHRPQETRQHLRYFKEMTAGHGRNIQNL